jgi:uncharacterized protein (TIGR03000 family)
MLTRKVQVMKRYGVALAAVLLYGSNSLAGLFDQGIGSAMIYGPYTGGHAYPFNTAYGYGLSWTPADSWLKDPFAYRAGYVPYRPYEWPIYCRVFPKPPAPYISVPGPDGLPVLVPTATPEMHPHDGPVIVGPGASASEIRPVPTSSVSALSAAPTTTFTATPAPAPMPTPETTSAERPALVRVRVPAGAEVWFDKSKMTQTGTDRVYQTSPLPAGKMQIYTVRAKWNQDGRDVEQFRVVGVRAGETAKLNFTSQP